LPERIDQVVDRAVVVHLDLECPREPRDVLQVVEPAAGSTRVVAGLAGRRMDARDAYEVGIVPRNPVDRPAVDRRGRLAPATADLRVRRDVSRRLPEAQLQRDRTRGAEQAVRSRPGDEQSPTVHDGPPSGGGGPFEAETGGGAGSWKSASASAP